MDTFCSIFLYLYSFYPHFRFLSTVCHNMQFPIFSIWLEILCYLIVFWRIRIEIVFSVKLTLSIDFAIQCKCRLYGIIKHFFIQLWQCSRLSCTNGTRGNIWSFIIIIGITRTPYFCFCFQLAMYFQSNDCFIFHAHFLFFPFPNFIFFYICFLFKPLNF